MSQSLWSVTRITHHHFPDIVVRVSEFIPGGPLHYFWMENKKQRSKAVKARRRDLGASDKAQRKEADRLGKMFIEDLAAARATGATRAAEPMTLARLADRYASEGIRKGSTGYKSDILAAVRRVVAALGPDLLVTDIKPSHLNGYIATRTAEGRKVAGRRDLVALAKACKWAEGDELIAVNPMAKPLAKEAMCGGSSDVSRPFFTPEDVERLLAAEPKMKRRHPAFPVLIQLAWHTGRRIGALLTLRWEDVQLAPIADSEEGRVTWYAGVKADKKKRQQTTRINREAHAALFAWRMRCPDPTGYLFPARGDTSQPMGRTAPKKWLAQAEKLAGLRHQTHGGWHMFRRGWATARKHIPVQDVMLAGGWKDATTVQKCYQHATSEDTLRAALFVA